MIPITELLIGIVLGLISVVAAALTLVAMVGVALRDNGVIDLPIPVWPAEKAPIAINPAAWGPIKRGVLIASIALLWWVYHWGLTNASTMPRSITRIGLGTFVIAAVAGTLFSVKVYQPVIYGLVEVFFGVAVAALTMYRLGDTIAPFEVVSLIAAVYFVVRGFDNLKKGIDEQAKVL
jgi:hypothetical protein